MKKDTKETIGGMLGCLVFVVLMLVLSFIYKTCSGAVAQLYPDDGEYASDDNNYYHRKNCGSVSEDNFVDWIDLETAVEEGLEPCPYCNPPTEESDE